jgi:hypothetical protein
MDGWADVTACIIFCKKKKGKKRKKKRKKKDIDSLDDKSSTWS